MRSRNFVAALSFLMASLAGVGCQTTNEKSARPPAAGVDANTFAALHVISAPVGLNLDGKPGLDGITLKVYASDRKNPKTVPINSGVLEIQMFDGPLTTNSTPLRVWTYEAAKVKPFEFRASLGTGYEFTLLWGESKPKSRSILVRAQHTSASGQVVRSSPSAITVTDMPAR